ncbi:MAG TPA: hypothetical protein VIU12_06925 [Chryseolinea sp.]
MKSTFRQRNGMALVIGLICVVIATILVVGFTVSMRLERQASGAMANNGRAEIIAQNAIEHAIALLDTNIPQPIPPGEAGVPQNWIVNPGLLTKFNGTEPVEIPLSTNMGDPAVAPTTDFANLNASPSGSADYPIIPTGEPVNASWVYVPQDPTADAGPDNPIVGRYAFWMDDENARININTAYGKPATILSDIPGTSPTRNYLVRNNPLDRTVDNEKTWFGISTFKEDVGFNSLVGDSYQKTGSDGVSYPFFFQPKPGDSSYPASNQNANEVGSNITSPAPAADKRRYYPLWHPSAVNIDILPRSLSDPAPIGSNDLPKPGLLDRKALADWVLNKQQFTAAESTQNWQLLKSPEQIKQFVSPPSNLPEEEKDQIRNDFYKANKFNLSAYSRAPEFNVFGKPRMMMEARIGSTRASPTSTEVPDTSAYNLSGTELAFYQTPDIDPLGPMYFHGFENKALYNGGGPTYYSDLKAVQMVGDYLSDLLARKDWPGMPPTSFVAKWGGNDAASAPTDDVGRREADQVAWNIVSLGNYAANVETYKGLDAGTWPPDLMAQTFYTTTNVVGADAAGRRNPDRDWLTNHADTSVRPDPNLNLRIGKLSGKAIMPFGPKPYLSEVALIVDVVPVDQVNYDRSKGFYLKFSMELELYIGKRCAPGTFWPNNNSINFLLTHFFYTVSEASDPAGAAIPPLIQGATGTPCDGDGGESDGYGTAFAGQNSQASGSSKFPWSGALLGGFPTPPISGSPVTYLPVDRYLRCMTTPASASAGGRAIYVSTGTVMQLEQKITSPLTIPKTVQKFNGTGSARIQAKARIALHNGDSSRGLFWQIIPVWDNVNNKEDAIKPPAGQQGSLSWDFKIDLSAVASTGGRFTRSLEIADPRLGGNTHDQNGSPLWKPQPAWKPFPDTTTSTALVADTLGNLNTNTFESDSYAYFDFHGGNIGGGFYKNSPRPSIGFLSCVPSGMQRGVVNSTLKFGPSANKDQLPDWLLLDVLAPMFADMYQPSFAPYSYLHSTMGKININAQMYPNFGLKRILPLEALFKNVVPDANLTDLVDNIVNHKLSGKDFGAEGKYDYVGELCEVEGIADGLNTPGGKLGTDWERMALIRNLANLITTQSNTFRLWGTAQAIRLTKGAGNSNLAAYEPGDTVTVNGEKRFEAAIERSVWTGVDGVPGNGHVNDSGAYDRKSTDTTPNNPAPLGLPWAALTISSYGAPTSRVPGTNAQWARFDGPDDPNAPRASVGVMPLPGWYWDSLTSKPLGFSSCDLRSAFNPARAHMTYKPIMFRYITE